LRKIIPNKAIKFEKIAGKFDYKMLMSEEVINLDREIIKEYRRLERTKKWLIRDEQSRNKKEGKFYVYKFIRNRLKEINHNEERIVNVLVEELYGRSKAKNKTTLWDCYGDILLMNLRENLKGN
jgi:tRNA G37 N-methylase Trm5